MTVYMSEQEQVEMLKSWWKKYGNIIIVVISCLLLIISGVRYWSWHKINIEQQASTIYEKMMFAYANNDYKQVRSNSRRLIDDFKSTIYADVASLTMAKMAVDREKYNFAKKSLAFVTVNSKSPVLISIARVRIARLLMKEAKYQEALSEISKVTDKSLLSIVNELRGDISLAQNKKDDAMKYYKKAMMEVEKVDDANVYLEIKSNRLVSNNIN